MQTMILNIFLNFNCFIWCHNTSIYHMTLQLSLCQEPSLSLSHTWTHPIEYKKNHNFAWGYGFCHVWAEVFPACDMETEGNICQNSGLSLLHPRLSTSNFSLRKWIQILPNN